MRLLLRPFIQSRKCMSLKFMRMCLCVMRMKNDAKIEENLTCQFKIDMKNFWHEHLKISKICTLMGCFWPKYVIFELKKVHRSYVWLDWRLMQNLKENWLVLSKMTRGIWQIFTNVRKSKNWDFYWALLSEVENVWA